jgi:NitT/TauT family transport system permease protein
MFTAQPTSGERKLQWGDFVVFGLLAFVIYGTMATAQRWNGQLRPDLEIDIRLRALPLYAVYSLFRGIIAYLVSLSFTLIIGYAAAKSKICERFILPLLDIGQSVPVLGFLPGLVLGLITLFPRTNVGLELACILMIFTGQVWNMTFSYYASLKAIPKQLYEMVDVVGLRRRQRLVHVELPFAATGLAWNSLMSMAGGWFFLTICESFTLGDKNFRLPGLGSYMATAIERGNGHAMVLGTVAMIVVIVLMDFFVWRPIISWTGRFRLEEQQNQSLRLPFISLLLRESEMVHNMIELVKRWRQRWRESRLAKPLVQRTTSVVKRVPRKIQARNRWLKRAGELAAYGLAGIAGFWIMVRLFGLMGQLPTADWWIIVKSTLLTLFRVMGAIIIGTLWCVPAAIGIGLSPRLTQFFQPIIQVLASFPAPMLYPIAIFVIQKLGLGLGFGSCLLMLLGVQWYIMFNALAGATGISTELREAFGLMKVSGKLRWIILYLPSIFPSLVTGWVTAAGGAWNASIVSEYVQYKGETLSTVGIGALISHATSTANYPLLSACLFVMIVTVVLFNRTVWRRFYYLAEHRFRFER